MKSVEWAENLAHAIIMQAVKDFRDIKTILKRYPKHEPSLKMEEEIEDFFLSDWFTSLTNLDGDALLERLREETEK